MLKSLKIDRKTFTRMNNPIPTVKNQTLTKIEQNMRTQGGGGALKRAAAPLFMYGKLYLCQRLIGIRGNEVFISSEDFAIYIQSI